MELDDADDINAAKAIVVFGSERKKLKLTVAPLEILDTGFNAKRELGLLKKRDQKSAEPRDPSQVSASVTRYFDEQKMHDSGQANVPSRVENLKLPSETAA